MDPNSLNEILFHSAFEANGYEKLEGLLKWEEYFKDKANLEIKNPVYKCTPLWIACNMGNVKQVELLLKAGADKETFGENGKTCIEAAEENASEDTPEYQQIIDLLNKDWSNDGSEAQVKDLSQQVDELKKSVTKLKSENKNLLIENSQTKKELEESNQNNFQKDVKISVLENTSKDFNLKKDEYEIQLGFLKERNEHNNKLIEGFQTKEEHYNHRILELTSKEEKMNDEIQNLHKLIQELNEKLERVTSEMLVESTPVRSRRSQESTTQENNQNDNTDANEETSSLYKLANNPSKLVYELPIRCIRKDNYYRIISGTRHQDYQEIWNARLLGLWYGFTSLKKSQVNPQVCPWENADGKRTHQSYIHSDYTNGDSNQIFIAAPKGKNVLYRLRFELENGIVMESKVFLVHFI